MDKITLTTKQKVVLGSGFPLGVGFVIGGVVLMLKGKKLEDEVRGTVMKVPSKCVGSSACYVEVKFQDTEGKQHEHTVVFALRQRGNPRGRQFHHAVLFGRQ